MSIVAVGDGVVFWEVGGAMMVVRGSCMVVKSPWYNSSRDKISYSDAGCGCVEEGCCCCCCCCCWMRSRAASRRGRSRSTPIARESCERGKVSSAWTRTKPSPHPRSSIALLLPLLVSVVEKSTCWSMLVRMSRGVGLKGDTYPLALKIVLDVCASRYGLLSFFYSVFE